MSGLLKDFFDRSYYAVLDRINGRPYTCLVCAGSDGSNAARQIERICAGWRLRLIADALIVCTRAQTPEDILRDKRIDPPDLERCTDLGAAIRGRPGHGHLLSAPGPGCAQPAPAGVKQSGKATSAGDGGKRCLADQLA
jgi:hypothetical protein